MNQITIQRDNPFKFINKTKNRQSKGKFKKNWTIKKFKKIKKIKKINTNVYNYNFIRLKQQNTSKNQYIAFKK